MKLGMVLLLSLIGLACTPPITKQSLSQHPGAKIDFEVFQPYQTVFATVLENTRTCYLHKPQKHQITVSGKRNNGKKNANVTVERVYAMAGHDVHMMIDMSYLSESKTRVQAYVANRSDRREIMSVEKWLSSTDSSCNVSWLS